MRSARFLIPRSILWLITKLSASVGSTMSQAQNRLYAYRSRARSRVVPSGSFRSTNAQVASYERPGCVIWRCDVHQRKTAMENQRSTVFHASNGVTELGTEQNLITDFDLLQLGHDAIRAVDVGPTRSSRKS